MARAELRRETSMVHGGRLSRMRYSGVAAGVVALLLVCFECARAQDTASEKALPTPLPRIEANRNVSPAGQLRDGVLTIRLEIREGDWFPEAETGPSVVVQAFAEEGRPLQVP